MLSWCWQPWARVMLSGPVVPPQYNLTELKSFGAPPPEVVNVMAAVLVLTAENGKIPKDRSWTAGKVKIGKADTFLASLKNYDGENIPEACLKAFE